MFSFHEVRCQSSLDKHGTIEFNTEYVTRRKPAWWVLLKLLGVAAMVTVGFGLALPTLMQLLPLWQAIAATTGILMIYMGIAFFVRPEPNTDNIGWGIGGMADDPTQYSDDMNRGLWDLHCVLGPGRFVSESLLDACVLMGLARGEEVLDEQSAECGMQSAEYATVAPVIAQSETTPLRADRFERPRLGPIGGQVELDSWRYMQTPPSKH